jgi:hypothetical protein
MCFGSRKPKRDPKVDEQLKKQEAEAEEARKKAAQEAADAKAAATERLKQEQTAPMSQPLNRQKETTQAVIPKSLLSTETAATKAVTAMRTDEPEMEPTPVSFAQARQERLKKQQSALGQTGRKGRRSGARGRRSLITGMGGGIGYYNRFFS